MNESEQIHYHCGKTIKLDDFFKIEDRKKLKIDSYIIQYILTTVSLSFTPPSSAPQSPDPP